MIVPFRTKIILIIFLAFIVENNTIRPNLKEDTLPEKRDYRPSKWVANSAMDIWYGNKSMIDVISREFADIMYKLTARQARSARKSKKLKGNDKLHTKAKSEELESDGYQASRVEINFINAYNETVHTIQLRPMAQPQNVSIFRVLEPLLGNPDF